MKKNLKLIIGIIIGIIVIFGIIFLIDYNRCSNLKEPIFVVPIKENDLTLKNTVYQGLGYRVEVKKNLANENEEEIVKVEMYAFGKFVTGSVAEPSNIIEQDNNDKENYPKFRAIVKHSTLQSIEVEPIEEEDKKILSDRVSIGLGNNTDMLYMEGTEVLITYTGLVMESYPTQIDVIDIQTETEFRTKIEELPQEYSLIQAIIDKCVINTNSNKIYNKDELDRFVNNVNNNIPDFIRCISYTIEGDMIITDVNFDGDNSYRVCFDWTRDKWSGAEDRTYKYCRYKTFGSEKIEDSILYYVDDPIEGEIGKMYIAGVSDGVEVINNYKFNYLLVPKESEEINLEKITVNELGNMYDYDIYYYGLENVEIKIDNTEIDLKKALSEEKVTMEQIIEQAEKDRVAGIIVSQAYDDGGSIEYYYDKYTIIKCNSLDGDTDVYIGITEMRLTDSLINNNRFIRTQQ